MFTKSYGEVWLKNKLGQASLSQLIPISPVTMSLVEVGISWDNGNQGLKV